MSHLQADNGLGLTTGSYRPVAPDPRTSFMSLPNPHSADLSPQAAMAAALVAAQSSAVAAVSTIPQHTDFSRGAMSGLDATSDALSLRLPNLDLTGSRPPRSLTPTHHMTPSIPLPSSLPPVHATNMPSNHPTPLPNSISTALPISHLTSDDIPYPGRPTAIPPIAYTAAQPTAPMLKPDQGIIPAAAQFIDTTVNRGRGRAMNGAVRKKSATPRRKKARTGPANFVCALVGCGKAFRMQGDLQTHMRKHTGVEPFACSFPDCGMRYKWRSSLSHHEGLHRKSKDFRLKPRRRRRSTATVMALPADQGGQARVDGSMAGPQAGMVNAAQMGSL